MLMDRTLIAAGVDLANTYDLVLESSELGVPAPKRHVVDLPGGDGTVDLTSALTGTVPMGNRQHEFRFSSFADERRFSQIESEIMYLLQGKRLDYRLSWEPEYTYTGGFTVETSKLSHRVRFIDVKVDADPWKRRKAVACKVRADGGRIVRLESGMKRESPVFESDRVLSVEKDGRRVVLPPGTHRAYGIYLERGMNELYVNSREVSSATWGDMEELTWADAEALRWFEVQRLGTSSAELAGLDWGDLEEMTWEQLEKEEWKKIEYGAGSGSTTYISYEWRDL